MQNKVLASWAIEWDRICRKLRESGIDFSKVGFREVDKPRQQKERSE